MSLYLGKLRTCNQNLYLNTHIYNKQYQSQEEIQNGFYINIYFVCCISVCNNTRYYFVCISRHVQWIEILGKQQVIWVLDVHMDFNTHSRCVLLGLVLSMLGVCAQSSGKVPVIYDEGFEPLARHPILHVKQACRQWLLAIKEEFITLKKLHLPRKRDLDHIVLYAETLLLGRDNFLCTAVPPA